MLPVPDVIWKRCHQLHYMIIAEKACVDLQAIQG